MASKEKYFMSSFYLVDGEDIPQASYVISMISLVSTLIVLVVISYNVSKRRHDDFFKYRSPITVLLAFWSLYVNQVFSMIRYKILYINGDIVCSVTDGKIRLSDILFAAFITFIVRTSLKLLYISLKQYWSAPINNIQNVTIAERIIKWLINNIWVEYLFLVIYFLLYIGASITTDITCDDDNVFGTTFFVVGIIICLISGLYIKKYGVNDSFGVRDEYLHNAICGLFVALLGSIATYINSGVTASPINCLYRMMSLYVIIFMQYHRSITYLRNDNQHLQLNSILSIEPNNDHVVKINNLPQPIAMGHSIELTFDFMMNWPELKEAFRKHIIKEFSGENLLFVDDAVAYKVKNTIPGNNNMIQEALTVYNTYIAQNANLQVNISAIQRGIIDTNVEARRIDCDVFNIAIREIRNLMNNDSWARFIISNTFVEMSKKMPNRPEWQVWTY